ENEIARWIKIQEEIGLDVLVHGEFERNDMVEFFPQTREVRKYRADWKNNRISDEKYNNFLENEIARWIKIQEEIGLDVLVHGEFERNDMVEFF
ncbi:hypothetical protein BUE67_15580, partial [Corynebacterium diphtheriae]